MSRKSQVWRHGAVAGVVPYQLDEALPASESLEVTRPEEVETGEYPYEVAEGGETVFEGNLIVE